MKLQEAFDLIARGDVPKGYRVHFEERDGKFLRSGYFPERDEQPFERETSAWAAAELFAARAPARFVNIYVVDDHFGPVTGYSERMARRYPERE